MDNGDSIQYLYRKTFVDNAKAITDISAHFFITLLKSSYSHNTAGSSQVERWNPPVQYRISAQSKQPVLA